MTQPTVLILPGLGNSGPQHWQSWLEGRLPGSQRVQQADWDAPSRDDWITRLESAVSQAAGPVVLIAHSLGCLLVAHWANREGAAVGKVAAALLVAPPDVESSALTPPEVWGFAPVPAAPLPFAAVVVGSRNDPYCPAERACGFAALWGADFIDAGEAGHLNTDAGFGPWPMGERLVRDLIASA